MNLYVLLKMVPDTVEELNVAADGKSLDSEFLRFKLSEPDDHALEQALILKEKQGGKVTVVALDAPEVDDVLFTALAKGADRAVKIPINQADLGTAATALNLPYVGVVCGVQPADGKVTVLKEFAGGLRGEFEVTLPAVLGIQSAEKPPRYVPVAKVRAAMKSAKIEEAAVTPPERPVQLDIERMYKPEAGGRAEMFEGAPEEVADKVVEVLAKNGVI
jgi:electron transfer flavoprotein beta subunit